MSEIKVNSIKGVGASTAAITVNNTDGTCTANITNNLSNRNLIINGAMQVAQRGTSNTTNGYGTVDRYYMGYANVDEAPTQSQIDIGTSDTPYTLGFRKAFRVTNGNQTSGAGAADYIFMNYSIEAQDLANSGWNYTSSSSNITLSFWIRSSVAQNFFLQFHTRDGTERVYTFETGALTADTWTKVTKTFPGSSLITINNDNGQGAIITMNYFFGTNYTNSDGSAASNVWRSYGDSVKSADQTTTWYTTNDATLDLVGFQLEVGSVATDFEHRSYGQELALCQRYCVVTTRLPAMSNNASGYISCCSRPNPVPMRAAPSVALGGTLRYNPYFGSGEHTTTTTPTLQANVEDNFVINFSGWSGSTPTNVFGDVYNTTITINAEL